MEVGLHLKKRFVEEGFEAALERKPREKPQQEATFDGAFVAHMEDALEDYHLPYDPDYPVVCMDKSSKQMIGEVREPNRARRDNQCALTMNMPETVWWRFLWSLMKQYPNAIKVHLVMDHLNTHSKTSLYQTFPA